MDIQQLKKNNYTLKKSSKNSSALKANSPNKVRPELNRADDNKKAANLTLSGSTFDSEIAFVKKILSNSRQGSLDSLKKIKQKISAGEYNNENVHKKISSLVSSDLSTLQQILSHPSDKKSSSPVITDVHKKQLLENPDVTKKVVDRITDDLLHL